MTPMRTRIYSGGPFEKKVGYCRATRFGEQIFVSGTTATSKEGIIGVGNPAAQTEHILDTISSALIEAGSSLQEIVRYRVYLTRIDDWESIAPVLSRYFGDIHPCNTLVAVADLVHPDMLVEIEADAIVGSASPVS